MEKFKHEEKFLDYIVKKTNELYSTIELKESYGITPNDLLSKNKFSEYYSYGEESFNLGIIYLDSIFVFDEDVYIYLSKNDPMISSFYCKIYYPIRKKKDVEFFILNLKKLKKNGN